MDRAPHSAEQFTPSRDHWWHADYLDLLARRLRLSECRSVLELGAGIGHWTALIAPRCAADAAITVVDREAEWVAALRQRFRDREKFTALQADVGDLAFLEGGYDLITCQTLLLHIDNVPAVLRQAHDLLAPGGLLLLAEPNNFLNRLPLSSAADELTAAEFGELAAFQWAFEKGRQRFGLGRERIAEFLPAIMARLGFQNLLVFCNDRAWPVYPPYATEEQPVETPETESQADRAAEREEARRYVLASGYDETGFARAWALVEKLKQRERRALAEGTLSSAGASNLFLFAARRAL